jgi:CheY-like chemotaxis protein/HPt (histidine-containing phosphotransfer) domain-containing protein
MNLVQRDSLRVLLAEDNTTNQLVAQSILKKVGVYCDVVANGFEALKALEAGPYDLVFMDCQMPEMDGFEATEQIRRPDSRVQNRDIPIIAMTAHAMPGAREECLQAGMNDYLPKPVEPQTLVEKINEWLPRAGETRLSDTFASPMGSEPQSSADSSERVLPVFDRTGMLDRLMGDQELAQLLIKGYIEDIPRQMQALKASLDTEDFESAGRKAHSIKGASANVGGEALRSVAKDIEKACATGDIAAAKEALPELEAQFETLKQAMRESV